MFTSHKQISPPSLVLKLKISEVSQKWIPKAVELKRIPTHKKCKCKKFCSQTRLVGEIYSSDVIMHRGHFKTFWPRTCPDPLAPLEKADQQLLVDTVGYSIWTCWLLQILLKALRKGELIANVMWVRFLRSSMKRVSIFFSTILTIATFPEKLKTRSNTWLATSKSSSLVWFALILEIA